MKLVNAPAHPHTIHFHGIHSAAMDGIPGAGETMPGESFTWCEPLSGGIQALEHLVRAREAADPVERGGDVRTVSSRSLTGMGEPRAACRRR